MVALLCVACSVHLLVIALPRIRGQPGLIDVLDEDIGFVDGVIHKVNHDLVCLCYFLGWLASLIASPAQACRSGTLKRPRPLVQVSQLNAIAGCVAGYKPARNESRGMGPTAALKRLMATTSSNAEKNEWVEKSRVGALLGSCPKSHDSLNSGTKAWIGFARHVLNLEGREFPPPIEGLLAWSALFKHHKTFSNYLGYVRLGCHMLNVSDEVFNSPMLRRAKAAVKKRRAYAQRPRMWIRQDMIRRILCLVDRRSESEWALAMLFLVAYVFLLRLPSEALPMSAGGVGCAHGLHSVISLEGEELCLRLASRKNMSSGSVMRRSCWCKGCKTTCPVHSLWPFFLGLGVGAQPFVRFSPAFALKSLRGMLRRLAVPDSASYRTHDIRRGHTLDLQENGASLAEILRAGQWKSPAFLEYLDLESLEKGAVVEAHIDESSSDDDG